MSTIKKSVKTKDVFVKMPQVNVVFHNDKFGNMLKDIVIDKVEDAIQAVGMDKEALRELELELKNAVAIVENLQTKIWMQEQKGGRV